MPIVPQNSYPEQRILKSMVDRSESVERIASGPTRRTLLTGLVSVALAGCAGTDSDRDVPYRHLDSEPLYLGSSFDATLPETVTRVDDPAAATLAVLSKETTVTGEKTVDWLRNGTPVAIAGRPAEENLQSLLTDGGYGEHFDSNLSASGDEEYLVAAVAPERDGEWLGTLLADSELDNPISRSLDDVLSGIVAE